MDKIIEALNVVRLTWLSGNQEEAYATLVDVIDELTTRELKKEPISNHYE